MADVYDMFRGLPPAGGDGGEGNFSIVLVLLCVIDGLATEICPGRNKVDDTEKRFKRLIRKRLHWGPEGKGKWVNKGNAADQLYAEFRNPLVQELGREKETDEPIASSRPAAYAEPVIGKWGDVPSEMRDITKIDALTAWDDSWPVLSEDKDRDGNPRYKLSAAGLYWTVKKLAIELAAEELAKETTARQ